MSMPPSPTNLRSQLEQHIQQDLLKEKEKFDPIDQVTWMTRHFWVPELKGPIQFADYQERSLRKILTLGADGLLPYSLVMWSDIKKSIKSTIAAAVALATAWHTDNAEIYIIANDIKQADSRVAHYFRRALELNPEFRGNYRQRGYRTTFGHNRAFVEAVPIDPSGEAGSNADLIVWSELWGAHEEAHRKMWAEMTLSPTKFGKSMRWVESYAGYSDVSKLLFTLYETGVKNGTPLWPETDYEIFENMVARMFCLWNTRPRLPWQTEAYYDSERATQEPDEFERMHHNQWVSSKGSFIPIEWWDKCKDPEIPDPGRNEPIVLALDGAVSDDTFGVLALARHPKYAEDTIVRYCRRWVPPKNGQGIDFQGTAENPGPEMEVRRLCQERNVVEVAYDPNKIEDMANRLRKDGVAWMRPFDQGVSRLRSDSSLKNRIRDRHIHHSGEPELREHIQNADAKKEILEDRTIRIVKRTQSAKIDLSICLSMGDYECMRLNL
jgi:hypothetical protein